MNAPIFPNCSYILAVVNDVGLQDSIARACAELRAQVLFCGSFSDVQAKLKILKRVTGIFVISGTVNELEMQQLSEAAGARSVPISESPVPKSSRDEFLQGAITAFVKTLVPKGLEGALVDACNKIMPGFYDGLGSFSPITSEQKKMGGHSHQVICSVVADSILGYCSIRAKTEDLSSKLDPATVLLEAANQSFGLIVQALVKKGLSARIGLPVLFDLRKIPEIQPLIYFPTVSVVDPKNRVEVSLGFFDFDGKPLFELAPQSIVDDSGDIEFL